jgi:hypothetical protein
MTKVYGIDLSKNVTPLMVRDAILDCFNQAHCEDAGVGTDDKESNKLYCQELVKKAFTDAEVDFDHPTKEGIMKVLEQLREFSKSFRNPEIIKKHYESMAKIVEKLK